MNLARSASCGFFYRGGENQPQISQMGADWGEMKFFFDFYLRNLRNLRLIFSAPGFYSCVYGCFVYE
jgi:hypothetical protein